MKLFQSYKQQRITDRYDVIVIGSGLGGLSVAAILAKEGKKVLVLERHYTAGGYTHVFKRRGYEWDVGLHYVGEVHRRNCYLRKLFDYVTDGRLQWAEMGEVYDRVRFGDKEYAFKAGPAAFAAQLKIYFPAPADGEAIDRYIAMIRAVERCRLRYFSEKAMPPWLARLVGPFMRSAFLKYSDRTTLSVLQELTDNERLIGVLTGRYGDYGLPPSRSSFAMHASLVKHFLYGGNYPVGGAASIARAIVPIIKASGGALFVCAEVKHVLVKGRTACGVVMVDGKEIRADRVVSDAGIMNTYSRLLLPECVRRFRLDEQLQALDRSACHVCLYVGLNRTAKQLGLGTANIWLHPDHYEHDDNAARFFNDASQDFPFLFISFPSAKDPDWERRYPGRSTIEIITLVPYEWFAAWEGRRWKRRGGEYDALKERFSQRMLEKLYRVEPQLRGAVDCYELSTPLSTRHFSNYPRGEVYGLDHSPQRFRQRCLRVHTPIRHLYLTGQDVIVEGIAGAINSGLVTASAILRKSLIKKIVREAETRRGG